MITKLIAFSALLGFTAAAGAEDRAPQLPPIDAGTILNQINSGQHPFPQPGLTTLDTCVFSDFKNNKCYFKCRSGAILTEPAIKPDFSAGEPAGACAISIIRPIPAGQFNKAADAAADTRWWSVDFVGSAHKAIMNAALGFINRAELTDMARAQSLLVPGSNDETGHPDPSANGGPIKEIWLGNTPFSKGGVLWNYEHFKFNEAYSRLGALCHLTQDQSVPAHAANIKHGTAESFEGYYTPDCNKVKIAAARDEGDMEPYAYYQDLQDDTRRHLAGWLNPANKVPYWTPASDAPPLGQDATYGPRGSYGGGRDVYSTRDQSNTEGGNNQTVTASPEIRFRQLAMAGAATVGVLNSASKRLPPLVADLSAVSANRSVAVKFTVLDNRSRRATYALSLFRNGALQGVPYAGIADLKEPVSPELMLRGEVNAALNVAALPAGNYVLDVRVIDSDGNTTPDEVNTDDIPGNDTKVTIVIN